MRAIVAFCALHHDAFAIYIQVSACHDAAFAATGLVKAAALDDIRHPRGGNVCRSPALIRAEVAGAVSPSLDGAVMSTLAAEILAGDGLDVSAGSQGSGAAPDHRARPVSLSPAAALRADQLTGFGAAGRRLDAGLDRADPRRRRHPHLQADLLPVPGRAWSGPGRRCGCCRASSTRCRAGPGAGPSRWPTFMTAIAGRDGAHPCAPWPRRCASSSRTGSRRSATSPAASCCSA